MADRPNATMTNGVHDGSKLERQETSGSITITPAMFERMYLTPQNNIHGDLRRTLGNPTPMGLGGFVITLSTLSVAFMGWRGAEFPGNATIGIYFFMGGMLAVICAILEFILGNSFPCAFFGVYGSFFIAYGATLHPSFGASTYYAMPPSDPTGQYSVGFNSTIGFLSIFMGLFSVIAMVCALRVNVAFVLAFAGLVIAFPAFSASEWYLAEWAALQPATADTEAQAASLMNKSNTYRMMAGGSAFGVSMIGWYILTALMLTTVDFPVNLPVGDLSTIIKGATEIAQAKKRANRQEEE